MQQHLLDLTNAVDILLPDVCTTLECGVLSVSSDALGFLWCADCSHRRDFLAWGYTHDWPALSFGPYALAAGIGYWCTTAFLGDDDRVVALLAAIEEWLAEAEVAI